MKHVPEDHGWYAHHVVIDPSPDDWPMVRLDRVAEIIGKDTAGTIGRPVGKAWSRTWPKRVLPDLHRYAQYGMAFSRRAPETYCFLNKEVLKFFEPFEDEREYWTEGGHFSDHTFGYTVGVLTPRRAGIFAIVDED